MLRSSGICALALLVAAFVVGCGSSSSSDAGADAYDGDGDAGVPTSCESQSDDSPCDDDNACTQTDTCQSGVCVGGDAVVCIALDQCHVAGTCDPSTGSCSDPAKDDDSACDDGNACTQTDTCQSGICTGVDPVECAAVGPCRLGSCDPATGVCSYQDQANGTICDDGVACTRDDVCTNGACMGTPYACPALDQCQLSSACIGDGTCDFTGQPDGTTCWLPDVCAAACVSGFCQLAGPGGMWGEGTLESPFLITTCDQLQAMGQALSCAYRLANDIDCSATATWNDGEGFVPVGNPVQFAGDFDGAGYRIFDLTINRPASNNMALFGMSAGEVHDVGLVNPTITAQHYSGSLVGWQSQGTVTNSYATGIIVTGGPGCVYVGGLVGHQDGTIIGSYAEGTVTGGTGCSGVGGLVGFHNGNAITNSYATVTVTAEDDSALIGGLVGVQRSGSITGCYAEGSVEVEGANTSAVGGLVGRQAGTITNCYATASVSGSYYVGGLVGQVDGALSNSYATGSVNGSYYDGQLVGMLQANGSITSCFATGTATATGFAGGLVGSNLSGAITDGYWFDNPGDSASHCYFSNGNTGCTRIDDATGIAYFYDTSNAPMSAWTFGPGSDWSDVCNNLFFPPLAWQGLSAADCH